MSNQPIDQPDADPEADDLFTGRVPILKALEQLRLRLLDLTRRNRLLNFKHSPGKCIQFVEAQPDPVFNRLLEGVDRKIVLLPIPDPSRVDWEDIAGRQTKPDAKDYARTRGINPSFELPMANVQANSANTLQTLFYPEDLARETRESLTPEKACGRRFPREQISSLAGAFGNSVQGPRGKKASARYWHCWLAR